MSALDDIYYAIQAGLDSSRWMQDAAQRWPARERAAANIGSLESGLAAVEKLRAELRDGRKHIEPPDDFKHTECYCSAPTCSPPCSWCTDPANNEEDEPEAAPLPAEQPSNPVPLDVLQALRESRDVAIRKLDQKGADVIAFGAIANNLNWAINQLVDPVARIVGQQTKGGGNAS